MSLFQKHLALARCSSLFCAFLIKTVDNLREDDYIKTMAKLSTGKIKDMIPLWFSGNKELKECIPKFFLDLDQDELEEALPNWAEELNCKADFDSVSKTIWDQFIDGEYWSRDTKHKCDKYENEFNPDVAGWKSDKFPVDDITKCTMRIFIPKNLGDNFRLEVITDENDSEVLMWNLIVD